MAFGWKQGPYPFHVYFGVFLAAAVPDVHTKLEHLEAVLHDLFAKVGIGLPVLFGIGREVKVYQNPHNSVGI